MIDQHDMDVKSLFSIEKYTFDTSWMGEGYWFLFFFFSSRFSQFKLGLLAKFLLRNSELNFKCLGASVLNTFGVVASCSRKKTPSSTSKSCKKKIQCVDNLCKGIKTRSISLLYTHISKLRGKGLW